MDLQMVELGNTFPLPESRAARVERLCHSQLHVRGLPTQGEEFHQAREKV